MKSMRNWRTTIAGAVGAGLLVGAELWTQGGVDLQTCLQAAVIAIVGALAKDAGVSGTARLWPVFLALAWLLCGPTVSHAESDPRLSPSDSYAYGAGPVEDDYQWDVLIGQPLAERDFISVGLCWIFDGADRSESEITTSWETIITTVPDPITGEPVRSEERVEHTSTNRVEGTDYSGLGLFAMTPLLRFDGFKANAGCVVPVEDLGEVWPAVGASYTIRGIELGEFVVSAFELGGVVLLKDESMYAVTLGLVW